MFAQLLVRSWGGYRLPGPYETGVEYRAPQGCAWACPGRRYPPQRPPLYSWGETM